MQQIHARGCETQAIDCIRWLLKIRHHAKVVAGRRVGRNPGEGEPPERAPCLPRAVLGDRGGSWVLRRRKRRREGSGGCQASSLLPSFCPRCLSPTILQFVEPDPSRIWELGETD